MSASEKPVDEPGREAEENKPELYGRKSPDRGDPVPLFLRDGNEGWKGNAQDEKDEIGE